MATKQTEQRRKPTNRTSKAPDPRKRSSANRPRTTQRKAEQEPARVSPDVVYLPPKPFNRSRLILRLATVAAVVVALILGLSIFFKVEVIEISGMQKYTAWDIENASGIEKGDNLLSFGRTKAAGKIISALPYVKSARIGIKLPDTVKIEVVEVEVTYAVKAHDGQWWLMSAEGKVVDKAANGQENRLTKILGVQLDNPVIGQQAVAWQDPQMPTDEAGDTVPVTVTATERLKTVVDIAGFLELNGIIGEINSIDVNYLSDIQLWYGQQFQVKLGGVQQLSIKIARMKAAVAQMGAGEGMLDITDPDEILFKEFS